VVPNESAPEGPRYYARRLPEPTRRELARRGARLTAIFARRLGPPALSQLRRRNDAPIDTARFARPLRRAFEDAGGTFVKFGQIIASSPGLFGEELADEFRACLDTGPVVAFDEVRRVVEDELGRPLEEVYASFDPTPVGRASIAVVHRATLRDGTAVAVKVLRPGIDHLVATDLDLMEPLFELLVRHTGAQLAGATLQQLDGLRIQIGEEIDLRNEARAMAHFARLGAEVGLDLIAVPRPYPQWSSRNVLTMEFLDGVAIDDLAAVEDLGVDPAPLIDQLIRGFFTMTLRWGTFHGDVHAGNLLLLRDGRIGVIDWGIVGRLDPATRRFFAKTLAAVLGDESAWAEVTAHIVANYGPAIREAMGMDDEQLTGFIRMMVEPILLRPFGEVSFAEMMNLTQVQVARANGVSFQSRSVRELWRRLRLQRRIHRLAVAGGGLMTEFDRGNFLLGKQLMYFERYGRLYLSDRAILSDRDFLARLLAESPE
jgi:predicted unusual protein kinase regulating ubiquinone biosynthesis (AarF/ABC1/UbiB family)